jgi:hypothetical protein
LKVIRTLEAHQRVSFDLKMEGQPGAEINTPAP